MVGCGASQPSPDGPIPVVATARDAKFQITLATPSSTFLTDEPVRPVAEVTYLGPGNVTVYHAASMVGFRIAEVGGRRTMGGGMDLPCLQTPMAAGQRLPFEFQKGGAVADNPAEGFDRAWYEEPELRLPPGRWQITAYLSASLGDCGGERHELETSIEVLVAP